MNAELEAAIEQLPEPVAKSPSNWWQPPKTLYFDQDQMRAEKRRVVELALRLAAGECEHRARMYQGGEFGLVKQVAAENCAAAVLALLGKE
jgi:hypothetical protein